MVSTMHLRRFFEPKKQVPTSAASTAASASEGVRDAMRTNYMDRLIDPGVWQCQSLGRFLNTSSFLMMCVFSYLFQEALMLLGVDDVVVVVAVLVEELYRCSTIPQ